MTELSDYSLIVLMISTALYYTLIPSQFLYLALMSLLSSRLCPPVS